MQANKIIDDLKKIDVNDDIELVDALFDDVAAIIRDDNQVKELVESKKKLSSDQEILLEMMLEQASSRLPTKKGVVSLHTINVFIDPSLDNEEVVVKPNLVKFSQVLKKYGYDLSNVLNIAVGDSLFASDTYNLPYNKVAELFSNLTQKKNLSGLGKSQRTVSMFIPVIIEENTESLFEENLGHIPDGFLKELEEAIFGSDSPAHVVSFLPFYDALAFNKATEFSYVLTDVLDQETAEGYKVTHILLFENDETVYCHFLQNEELAFKVDMYMPSRTQREFVMADTEDMLVGFLGFRYIEDVDGMKRFLSIRDLH